MTRRVSAPEARQLLDEEGYVYLDVRSVPEFEEGHPTGAFNIPLLHAVRGRMEENPRFVDAVEQAFPREAKLVVGCRSGVRSLRAAQMLAMAGFTDLVDLRPGFGGRRDPFGQVEEQGWADAGLPTSTEAEAGRAWAALDPGRER